VTADQEALVTDNIKLVYHIINKRFSYVTPDCILDKDDLFQLGCMGLMRAAELYDPALGKFSTYAADWIRQCISRGFYYAKPNQGNLSLDYQIAPYTTLTDIIPSREDVAETAVNNILLFKATHGPDERTNKMMRLLAQGYGLRNIGRQLGCTGERVRQITKARKYELIEGRRYYG
jgi:RNA polymerase sigma factor (sigma-70 family)